MKTVLPKTASRCMGECCEDFAIHVRGVEVTYTRAQTILAQVRFQSGKGKWPEEEIEEFTLFLQRLIPHEGTRSFRCREFDREKRECSIYSTRPEICSRYGVATPCQHPNCQWKDAARPEMIGETGRKSEEVSSGGI